MQRDVYLLGDSDAEIEHLVNQAEVYAAEADQLLERIGIAVGATVADVGCGTLGILHLLCARVGPNGRVVGIDREQRMVDYGRLVTKQRNLPVEFFQEDATNLGLPSNEFDFVHCRTLLLNVADPAAVLAEMVRITRPGGVVAVQEPDAAAWVCDPPHPAFQALRDELVAAYASSGKDFYIGRRLPSLLRCSGLEDVEVIPTARATRPGEFYHTFLLTLTNLVREQILAGGRMSAEEFESHSTALSEHLGRPESVTCQPMVWQAWATKP
jgi:SAM-dependent methyltransferase